MSTRQSLSPGHATAGAARSHQTKKADTSFEQTAHRHPLVRFAPVRGDAPRPGLAAAALIEAGGGRLVRVGPALLELQRRYGNRYVQRLVAHRGAPVGSAPVIQAKLAVGPPTDEYEREADRVAERVVRLSGHHDPDAPVSATAHRARGGGNAADADVRRAIDRANAGGHAIPGRVREAMERALGADLGAVRVHTDAAADLLSRSLQARAFTTGRDIFFRQGAFAPHSGAGQRLLAHELTHVLQQRAAAATPGNPGHTLVQRDFQPGYRFPGRDQKRIGVGEKVKLTVKPPIRRAHQGRLDWVASSPTLNGSLGATDAAGEAEFVAGDTAGRVILACQHRFTGQILDRAMFDVVEPTGGHMRQVPGTQTRHIQGSWNVSFVGNQFLHPTSVSFHNIDFMEGAAPAQYDPSEALWKAERVDHQAGPWVDVSRALDGAEGSQVGGDDWVSSGLHDDKRPKLPRPVTQKWSIPWFWRLSATTGAGKEFTRMDHVAYDYGGGHARLTKGGVDVQAQAGDPSQWFFPNVDDNIAQLKGYYDPARHAPGYGTGKAWPDMERRLRGFTDVGPMADLIYVARENKWEPPDPQGGPTLSVNLTLDELITAAALIWRVQVPH